MSPSRNILFFILLFVAITARSQIPTNLVVDPNPTMGGTVLPVSLTWSNMDNTLYVAVYSATNGGPFGLLPNEIHNPGTIHSGSIPIGQGDVEQFKVSYNGVGFSETVSQWGAQQPSSPSVLVANTNQVLLSLDDNAFSLVAGYRWEQATNSDFTGNTTNFFFPLGTNKFPTMTLNFPFLSNTRYYWRSYATNSGTGKITQPSVSVNAQPNALPEPALPLLFYLKVQPDGTVLINWTIGAGWIKAVTVQCSVGNTNGFTNLLVLPSGSFSISDQRVDSSQTVGTTVYYRIGETNDIGTVYSIIRFVTISPSVNASTFYIAPFGNGNGGTNWTTAWPNWSSIQWNSLQPGSTVWVTNGDYNELVVVPAASGNWSGGTTNLSVTFKYWTNSSASSQCRLGAFVNQHLTLGYITLDGARNDNFVYTRLSEITNNMGFQFVGNSNLTGAIYVNAYGMKALWCEAYGDYANAGCHGGGAEGCTVLFTFDGGVAQDAEYGYLWGHDGNFDIYSGCDGFTAKNYTVSDTNSFHNIRYHDCVLERLSGNYAGGSASHSDYVNIIMRDWIPVVGGTEPLAAHPDAFQAGCYNTGITNLEIYNIDGYGIYIEANDAVTPNVFVSNCRFYSTSSPLKPKAAIQVSTEPSVTDGMSIILTNLVIDHCTFYGMDGGYFGINRRDTNQDGTVVCTNLAVKSLWLKNNLVHNTSASPQFGATVNISEHGSYSGRNDVIDPDQVHMDNNNSWGGNSFLGLNGTNYLVGNIGSGNVSVTPVFNDISTFDFRPTQNSAAAMVGSGGNPRDAYGYLRSAFANSIGAFTFPVDTALKAYPALNEYTTGTFAPDATPFDNEALAGLNFASTNYPVFTNCPGGFPGMWCGYQQYLCITNCNRLTNLTQMSLFVRGRMTGPGIDCAFFDSGSLDTNGWAFGRDDSIPMRFWVVTDNGNKSNMCGFPQDSIGSDSGFHAWGISLGIVGTTLWGTNYYDGVAVATNSTGPVSRLTIAETYKWLAIGRRKHGHTTDPDVSPDTPNGFVFGPMADPRIYDRALSGAEQLAVFQNQPTQGGGGGGGGGSPTNSFPSRLKGKIRIRGSGTIK